MDLICRDKPLVAAVFAYPVRTKICSQCALIIALYSSLKNQIIGACFTRKRFGGDSLIAYRKKHIEIDDVGNASQCREGRKPYHDTETSRKKMQEHDCPLQVILSRSTNPEIRLKGRTSSVCREKFINKASFINYFTYDYLKSKLYSLNDTVLNIKMKNRSF